MSLKAAFKAPLKQRPLGLRKDAQPSTRPARGFDQPAVSIFKKHILPMYKHQAMASTIPHLRSRVALHSGDDVLSVLLRSGSKESTVTRHAVRYNKPVFQTYCWYSLNVPRIGLDKYTRKFRTDNVLKEWEGRLGTKSYTRLEWLAARRAARSWREFRHDYGCRLHPEWDGKLYNFLKVGRYSLRRIYRPLAAFSMSVKHFAVKNPTVYHILYHTDKVREALWLKLEKKIKIKDSLSRTRSLAVNRSTLHVIRPRLTSGVNMRNEPSWNTKASHTCRQ